MIWFDWEQKLQHLLTIQEVEISSALLSCRKPPVTFEVNPKLSDNWVTKEKQINKRPVHEENQDTLE